MNAQPGEQPGNNAIAELVSDRLQGAAHRLGWAMAAVLGFAQRAGAIPLLRKIDQMEVTGEGMRDFLGAIERPRGHRRAGLLLEGALRVALGACADDAPAQHLDISKQQVAAVLGDHLAEEITGETDILAKRERHLPARDIACGGGGRVTLAVDGHRLRRYRS